MRRFGALSPEERAKVDVLELGCGAGAQIKFLVDEGFPAVGVDGSIDALAQARENIDGGFHAERPRPLLLRADIENWVPLREFDVIVDICTLQHLPAAAVPQVIQHALHWLKPGGFLFSKWAGYEDGAFQWPSKSDVPQPQPIFEGQISHLFPGFQRNYGVERVEGLDNVVRQHWIIEARKA